jgi:glycosyltransferase involved in cell wall biosynthesis
MDISKPLVSVIIPAYNAGGYITATIDSVLGQTYQNLEIIIINDGSTDNTSSIVNSYSDPRIRFIEQENRGQCKASNAGLSVMKGDLIKFLDADDILNSMHIELQVQRLNHRTDAICSCEWGRFYDGNPSSAQFVAEAVWKDLSSLEWVMASLQQPAEMMGAWLWLIPKPILDKAGFWNEELSLNNDFEFSCRILMAAEEVLFTPGAKLFYRSGNSSLSASKNKAAYEAAFLSTKLGSSYLLEKENTALMRQICANKFQQWVYQFYP